MTRNPLRHRSLGGTPSSVRLPGRLGGGSGTLAPGNAHSSQAPPSLLAGEARDASSDHESRDHRMESVARSLLSLLLLLRLLFSLASFLGRLRDLREGPASRSGLPSLKELFTFFSFLPGAGAGEQQPRAVLKARGPKWNSTTRQLQD